VADDHGRLTSGGSKRHAHAPASAQSPHGLAHSALTATPPEWACCQSGGTTEQPRPRRSAPPPGAYGTGPLPRTLLRPQPLASRPLPCWLRY